MATLVLSTVGTALGGPIGGALGSLVGQAIDQQLFGPGPRRGPRLGDLAIQTSAYGTPIPRIYGAMRVAGSVVWATDLKEEEAVEGGGKSGPEVISYAYSASFAVALSSRRAVRVGRIWADGKLLRGEAGDFRTACKFRFLPGSEDQAVDPLIASVEGLAATTAFRGLALAVFEDLALVEFGNRIPVLTFELFGDTDGSSVVDILSDVSDGLIEGPEFDAPVGGFAAYGSDRRGAIEEIIDLWGVDICEAGSGVKILSAARAAVAVEGADRGCRSESQRGQSEQRAQEPARSLPSALALTYYDAARDYQAGQMRAVIAGGGRTEWRIDCPAVLDAGEAKRLANDAMARRWAARDGMTIRLPPSFLEMQPGGRIKIGGNDSLWLAESVTIDGLVVVVELRRAAGAVVSGLPADPGRAVQQRDEPIGETKIALFDLPALPGGEHEGMNFVLAGSADGSFKSVPVQLFVNGQVLGSTSITKRAVLGTAIDALPAGSAVMIDQLNSVVIQLHDPDQLILNADDDALAAGANLSAIGRELVQFGRAESLGNGRYRLSRLLRARRGTEWAMSAHAAGDAFLLLDRAALVPVGIDPSMRGGTVMANAFGVADPTDDPPSATLTVEGEGLRPLSPAHLRGNWSDGGDLNLKWVPRSVGELAWTDYGADSSVGRRFEVVLTNGGASWSAIVESAELGVAADTVEGLGGRPLRVEVSEIGGQTRSRPAAIEIDN